MKNESVVTTKCPEIMPTVRKVQNELNSNYVNGQKSKMNALNMIKTRLTILPIESPNGSE